MKTPRKPLLRFEAYRDSIGDWNAWIPTGTRITRRELDDILTAVRKSAQLYLVPPHEEPK